jgi:hypothetical protein
LAQTLSRLVDASVGPQHIRQRFALDRFAIAARQQRYQCLSFARKRDRPPAHRQREGPEQCQRC